MDRLAPRTRKLAAGILFPAVVSAPVLIMARGLGLEVSGRLFFNLVVTAPLTAAVIFLISGGPDSTYGHERLTYFAFAIAFFAHILLSREWGQTPSAVRVFTLTLVRMIVWGTTYVFCLWLKIVD